MRTGSRWTIDATALCLTAALLIPAVGSVEASPQDGERGVPHPPARLEFMLGSSTASEVESLDEEGQVVRTSAQRPEALDALDAYTGHWRSEDRTTQQGETLHFEYELAWIDPGRTIVELLITRVGPDGTSTVFDGYKGADPAGGVYYFAVSPSGRGARGQVLLEGDELITLYDGWTPEGDVVEIRDVFEPVGETGDSFRSRTFLRRSPDAEWRQIGEDHWRRLDS